MYNKRCIRNIGAQYTLFLFPGAVKIRSALRGTMHRFEYVVSTKATPALTWEVYTNWKMWHTFANIYGRMHWQHGEPWSIGSRMEIEILKPIKVVVDHLIVNCRPGRELGRAGLRIGPRPGRGSGSRCCCSRDPRTELASLR